MGTYNLDGFKWGTATWGTSSGTISWSVDWTGLDTGTHTTADYLTVLESAMAQWENVAAVTFAPDPVSSASAEVHFSFGTFDGPGGTLGETTTSSSVHAGALDSAYSSNVVFDQAETWSLGGTYPDPVSFLHVATHEIGHVLGLDHPQDSNQIMYAYLTANDHLSNGDIYGAQLLYGTDGSDVALTTDPGADPGSALPGNTASAGTTDTSIGGGGSGIFAAIIGLVLTIIGGIAYAVGNSSSTGAMTLDDETHPGGDHGGHGGDTVAHADTLHTYDLADVIPITHTIGEEHGIDDHAEPADEHLHHDLISAI